MPLWALVAAMAGCARRRAGRRDRCPARPAARDAFERGRTAFGRAEYAARHRDPAPAALPGGAARQRGRGRAGAPHAGRRLPVREQARRGAARVPQAARAAPRLPVRSAARSAAGRRLLQRRASRRRRRASPRSRRGAASASRRSPPAGSARPRACAPAARRSCATSGTRIAVNFVPFGAGQFQNGQRRKGWLFFGAEAVLGAVSVGAFATNFALYGADASPQVQRCRSRSGIQCPPGDDRSLPGGHVAHAARRPGRQRRPVLRGRDLGRHRRRPSLPARGAARRTAPSRARAGSPARPRLTFSPDGLGAAWAF